MRKMAIRGFWVILLVMMVNSVIAQTTDPTPTSEPAPTVIQVWLPDQLIAPENASLAALFQAQTLAFMNENPLIIVETRFKATGTTGGIMSTLRSASTVAPSALPTLTLLRRQNLVTAQRTGLIISIEGAINSAAISDYGASLHLSQINTELYGVPYLIDLQHLVYRPTDGIDYQSWTFDAMLEREIPFTFVAGRVGGINDIVLAQYLEAGGTINADGVLQFNADALNAVLEFYEQAVDRGLIGGDVLNYTNSSDYATPFRRRDLDIAIFDSTTFFQLQQGDSDLQIASLPTLDGAPLSVLNGWMWVYTSHDLTQREEAFRYISWMNDSERQSQIALNAGLIPARRSAMMLGLPESIPPDPYLGLLENATLPFTETEGGVLSRLMQAALVAVITGEQTAEQATDSIEAQMP